MSRAWRAVLVGALAISACRRAPTAAPRPVPPSPPPALGEVLVDDVTPSEDAPARLDADALVSGLRARLAGTGMFAPAAGDAGAPATTRVRARVIIDGAEVGDRGVARARVHLWLDTRPSNAPGAINEQLDGAGEHPYVLPHGHTTHAEAAAASRARFEDLVLRIAGDLASELAGRRRLAVAAPEELRAALQGDGGELRLEAIRAIGARHVTGNADALLPLLDDEDEVTRDAALGALIALGDRRAVSALTRSRSLRDGREMRKVIEAVSQLGGEEADDYLSFVASSHDDEEIRAEAAAARARMQRRAADGGR
ncbi:MAG TPA: HEAT repeat domain-containing protein [Polyangia bacterium]|nr:HEAT repeat domain-containing protein [Polyangia bacterium]